MKPYMQYLVVLLDDTSVAYCHANNPLTRQNLMPLETLRKAIIFGMKQNLMIQFVYPKYELPVEYNKVIESIDHIKIGREVLVFDTIPAVAYANNLVLRLTIDEFITKHNDIAFLLQQARRINICLTDIENFRDEQIAEYKKALTKLSSVLLSLYKQGKSPQLNILTDRLQLTQMHNCEAGIGNITIAPNGKFYLCPAFYYDEQMGISNRMNYRTKEASRSVGDMENGLKIPNKQLLELGHAPLCRICDAYHCNRCIWLNQKLTWDNNTPSRQQCIISHLERNAARDLQLLLKEAGYQVTNEIKEITYLDPFEVKEEF
jgi:CXXX repeat peptide maturase